MYKSPESFVWVFVTYVAGLEVGPAGPLGQRHLAPPHPLHLRAQLRHQSQYKYTYIHTVVPVNWKIVKFLHTGRGEAWAFVVVVALTLSLTAVFVFSSHFSTCRSYETPPARWQRRKWRWFWCLCVCVSVHLNMSLYRTQRTEGSLPSTVILESENVNMSCK